MSRATVTVLALSTTLALTSPVLADHPRDLPLGRGGPWTSPWSSKRYDGPQRFDRRITTSVNKASAAKLDAKGKAGSGQGTRSSAANIRVKMLLPAAKKQLSLKGSLKLKADRAIQGARDEKAVDSEIAGSLKQQGTAGFVENAAELTKILTGTNNGDAHALHTLLHHAGYSVQTWTSDRPGISLNASLRDTRGNVVQEIEYKEDPQSGPKLQITTRAPVGWKREVKEQTFEYRPGNSGAKPLLLSKSGPGKGKWKWVANPAYKPLPKGKEGTGQVNGDILLGLKRKGVSGVIKNAETLARGMGKDKVLNGELLANRLEAAGFEITAEVKASGERTAFLASKRDAAGNLVQRIDYSMKPGERSKVEIETFGPVGLKDMVEKQTITYDRTGNFGGKPLVLSKTEKLNQAWRTNAPE